MLFFFLISFDFPEEGENKVFFFFSAVQLETLTRNCEGEGIAGN